MPKLDFDPTTIPEKKHSLELDSDEFHLIFHCLRLGYAGVTNNKDIVAKEFAILYDYAEYVGYERSMNLERKLRILHREFCADAPEVTDPPK